MTLIAGTDGPLVPPLLKPNDKIVPVDSVFCRTTDEDDGDASLLTVKSSANKYEVTAGFDHLNFGGDKYRIKDNPAVSKPILDGLSDWVVGKTLTKNTREFDDNYTISFAEIEVEVEYNVRGRDVDRLALVMYGMDGNEKWHIFGTHTDAAGKIIYSVPINGNSLKDGSVRLSTSHVFKESDGIWKIVYTLSKLKPGQTKVPLEPSAHFALP